MNISLIPSKTAVLSFLFILIANTKATAQGKVIYNPERDENDIAVFMNMIGFDYHKFQFISPKPVYINVYIDEYLNDQLINSFDHVSANRKTSPEAYFNLIFPKIDSTLFTLKIYTLSKSDSIETIQFRIGELGLFRNLNVNRSASGYSWKLANFQDDAGPKIEVNKKIALMYYTTGVKEKVNNGVVNAFCNVPNILDNRHLIENKGKIEHYFEVGMKPVEKLE